MTSLCFEWDNSNATEPPPTPTKTSGSADYADVSDNDQSDSDSEERAAAITSKGKGKAGMKTVVEIESGSDSEECAAAITGQENEKVAMQEPQASNDNSNMPLAGTPFADLPYSKQLEIVSYALEQATPHTIGKRKIEEVTVESDEDEDGDRDGDGDGSEVEFGDGDDIMEAFDEGKAATQLVRTTAMTSVMASQKPKVLPGPRTKKIKSETASQTSMMLMPAVPTVSESMLADMATKPKTGSQWRNTDLLPIMLENGTWCRQLIPTVLLWAGSQPNFWTIKAPDLLCALQAIFATMYPGVEHKVQLKGPIMGVATQRLCMWWNNFGSTAIALVSNVLSSVNENIDNDEQADNDSIDVDTDSDAQEKIMVHMAHTLLKDYAFLFADPNTCQTSEIYRSIFMLQMIATVHLNTFIGFVDMPELNTSALPSMQMEGVISACAVALKHAFKLVTDKEKKGMALKTPLRLNKATGKESSAQLAFSESNWGTFTRDYYLFLLRRSPNYTVDTIIMAYLFVKDSSSDGSIKGLNVEGGVAAGGERAMLCECFFLALYSSD
ncbi:hypothetical protein BD769DRAFT_1674374 [Suillus cothurnatus]|nr:hypothetical protein BD769DRAFT_1674374 [Suillus cothurnatus]